MKYCDVVVDISHEKLDKSFQYKIPEELSDVLIEGMQVVIPFGRGSREITGFVVGLSDKPKFDPSKTKEVIGIVSIILNLKLVLQQHLMNHISMVELLLVKTCYQYQLMKIYKKLYQEVL